jgi:YVTN family beta-propeller protein
MGLGSAQLGVESLSIKPSSVTHSSGRLAVPDWIAITPDSSRVYVSNSGARSVTVIDAATVKPITNIPVGEVPKRLNTLDLSKIR